MARVALRIVAFTAGIALASLRMAGAPAGASTARPRLPAAGGVAHAGIAAPMLRRRNIAACAGSASNTFIGIPGAGDVAAVEFAGVMSGENNDACINDSGIGSGTGNQITTNASDSFIAAGVNNTAEGYESFVGVGQSNFAIGMESFVGGGALNYAYGNGSFIGAGDFTYGQSQPATQGNYITGADSFIGAGDLNKLTGSGSFIGAGDYIYAMSGSSGGNEVTGNDSFIGAGDRNDVSSNEAFLGAGSLNFIEQPANYAVIVAGASNDVRGAYGTVVDGEANVTSGEFAAVLDGYGNTASGEYAVVPGGDGNTAAGILSFAGGYHADAVDNGSFVWSDYRSGSALVKDTAANQFVARASGGVYLYSNEAATTGVKLAAGSGTWASLSDRAAKTDVVPLDDASILAKVAALPVTAWRYKTESGVRHVGPMAQDFYAAFGVGEDDRHITAIDEDGVALAAIKALHDENIRLRADQRRKDGANDRLASRLTAVEAENAKLERLLDAVAARLPK